MGTGQEGDVEEMKRQKNDGMQKLITFAGKS
jgi:hypothetical protein